MNIQKNYKYIGDTVFICLNGSCLEVDFDATYTYYYISKTEHSPSTETIAIDIQKINCVYNDEKKKVLFCGFSNLIAAEVEKELKNKEYDTEEDFNADWELVSTTNFKLSK